MTNITMINAIIMSRRISTKREITETQDRKMIIIQIRFKVFNISKENQFMLLIMTVTHWKVSMIMQDKWMKLIKDLIISK